MEKEAEDILSGYNDRLKRLQTLQEDKDDNSSEESNEEEQNNAVPDLTVVKESKKKRVLRKSVQEPEEALAPDATIRYQKTKINALECELQETVSELKEIKLKYGKASSKLGALTEENTALGKKLQNLSVTVEKQKNLNVSKDTKKSALENELASIRLELEELRKAEKLAVNEARNKDLRLNRALEEVEKLKSKLKEIEANREGNEVARKDYEKLLKENQRLDKQKNDMLQAFKKQMKLVDILKRQKIHMEAAKMLAFTEEEFNKTLELNEI